MIAGNVARLCLLDGFHLTYQGVTTPIPRGLQRIVAVVGLRPGATRSHLAGLLWPDRPENRALGCLRTGLWRLRGYSCCPILTTGDTVHLDPSVNLDVDDLINAVACIRAGTNLDQAGCLLVAGRDDLLPGWYEDWVLLERERLRQLRLHALEDIAQAYLKNGQHGEALQAAIEAMRAEPLRESPHRLIVKIHLSESNFYEALQAFYLYRDLVLRDLQLEPSAAMHNLVAPILAPITYR